MPLPFDTSEKKTYMLPYPPFADPKLLLVGAAAPAPAPSPALLTAL